MKKLSFLLFAMMMMAGLAFGQSPEAINYQAVARDGAGALMSSQSMDIRIGIYSGAGAATLEYEETHTVTTNQYGQFSLKIGNGSVTSGTFGNIDWAGDEHHLKVEADPGSGYVDLGTSQLVSVPYALHATEAEVATNMDIEDLNNVNTSSLTSGDFLQFNGTDWVNTNNAGQWMSNGNDLYYNGGYVGIGTNNPGAGLELNNAAGYGSGISLNNTGGGLEWRMTSWTDGTFRLVKATGTTISPIVVEPQDGYVGIGTSTPNMPLSVHASSGISYIRVSDNTTGPTSGLRMGCSGSGNAYIINDESNKSLSLGTDGTTQVRINDIGRVGINELSPDMMLHIKQDAANKGLRIEHQTATDYWENGVGTTTKNFKFYYNNLFRADISSTNGAYTQSSDRRLKKNILPMNSVLPKVKQLEAATYNYIDQEGDKRSMGFMAQDVEGIFPELVNDLDDGYKGIVYDGFAVISIKAIQELTQKVEALEKEVKDLRTQVANQ